MIVVFECVSIEIYGKIPADTTSSLLTHPGASMQPDMVITGFGPFGPHDRNPSDAFAHAVHDALQAYGVHASPVTLPVTWGVAARAPAKLGADGVLIVHCGLAADRAEVNLERGASNVAGPTPDVEGVVATGVLDAEGPARLTTTLDLDALELAMAESLGDTLGVRQSDDAGTYICNAIYYRALQARGGDALFVHIPDLVAPDEIERVARAFADALASVVFSRHNADV
jgi:pyroglutamyl-peptidase